MLQAEQVILLFQAAAAGTPQIVQLARQVGVYAFIPSCSEQPADILCQFPVKTPLFFGQCQPADQKQVLLRR